MPAVAMTAVLIVADHELATEAIRRELRDASACSVVGCVDGRRSCTAAVAEAQPDVVVIVEASTPASTLERIGDAAAALPEAKVVLLTDRMEADWLDRASAAGVDAAIARTLQTGSLATFLHEVARGNAFHTFESLPPRKPQRQTALIARGLTPLSSVHRNLGVAHRTEATHRAHIDRFPGSRTTARLAAEAA